MAYLSVSFVFERERLRTLDGVRDSLVRKLGVKGFEERDIDLNEVRVGRISRKGISV
jgi:hypothetical protein